MLRCWSSDFVLLALVALVGVAAWQFHSLTRSDGLNGGGYMASRHEPSMDRVTLAARPLPK